MICMYTCICIQTSATWVQPAFVRVERHSDTLLAGEDATPFVDLPMMPTLEVCVSVSA